MCGIECSGRGLLYQLWRLCRSGLKVKRRRKLARWDRNTEQFCSAKKES